MESLTFFRRTYKDPVVEYYFLPWRDDIRLTRRFGKVFVHLKDSDSESKNILWKPNASFFRRLSDAEQQALRICQLKTQLSSTAQNVKNCGTEFNVDVANSNHLLNSDIIGHYVERLY